LDQLLSKLPDPANRGLPARARRSNLHIAVSDALGTQVIAGTLPVGTLLPKEAELGARFGVSRTVVREAVKVLISKGLLDSGSGIGTWVLPAHRWNFLDPTVFSWARAGGSVELVIANLFTFRNAVEPAAAAEAARCGTRQQFSVIRSALDVMRAEDTDFDAWVDADVQFHTAIYIASNNVFLASLAALFREYFEMSFSVSSSNAHYRHCLQEHIDVYRAIAARRPVKAADALRVLLEHANSDVRMVARKKKNAGQAV
jgi:DNA-binding FadR family transcriptional regulator